MDYPNLDAKQRKKLDEYVAVFFQSHPLYEIEGFQAERRNNEVTYSPVFDQDKYISRGKAIEIGTRLGLDSLINYPWYEVSSDQLYESSVIEFTKRIKQMGLVPRNIKFYQTKDGRFQIDVGTDLLDPKESIRALERNFPQIPEIEHAKERIRCLKGEDYTILGAGMMGVVYKVRYEGKPAAIKVVNKREAELSQIASDSGFGPELYDVVNCNNESSAIIMELAEGTLENVREQIIQSGTVEKELKKIFCLLVECCSHGINHKDLKLTNIFYKTEQGELIFMLGDYGMALKVDVKSKDDVFKLFNMNWKFFISGFIEPYKHGAGGERYTGNELEFFDDLIDLTFRN